MVVASLQVFPDQAAKLIRAKKYLASHGIKDVRIKSVGKGESEPVVDCTGVKGNKQIIECLAPNRRVVVDATHKQEDGCVTN